MPIKIEQITKTGLVVNDYDHRLSPSDVKNILNSLPSLEIQSTKNPFIAKYKNKVINLCVKNISYLGVPHLHHKKRIQIPKEWKEMLQQENTFLLGIYSYKRNTTFCLFDTTKYRDNQLNNSSAHIHTIDLHKARKLGIFNKIDKNKNHIAVFTEQNFTRVFDIILFDEKVTLSNEINVFNEFSKTLDTDWSGINCYKEMMKDNFNHAYQPEWAGFYLEYKFENFLKNNAQYAKYCQYIQNKKSQEIDLDLWFEEKKFYGDLKAHTVNTNILGNDKQTVIKAIKGFKKIWYVAFSHHTTKDIDCDGSVTKFWNTELNNKNGNQKKKLDSYLSRMKHSVTLNDFVILEINNYNKKYLSDFRQGRNSNNNPRNAKISIKKSDIKNDNFAIYRQKL